MKHPTIAEIAGRAGVSIGAVSLALNGQPGLSARTRQRILDIANEVGWRPSVAARSISGSRAHSVGLVVSRDPDMLGVEPFHMRFVAGLQGALSRRRTALLMQVAEDHDAAIETMRRCWAERRIDGVVLTDLWAQDQRVVVVEKLGIPAVLVGRPRSNTGLPAVWSDDVTAVVSAVDHLVALGHRKLARVAGLSALDHTQVRVTAFRKAVLGHGLGEPRIVRTDYRPEEGARATRVLLSRGEKPTAIVYDNDVMAVAGLAVAREMGISVPAELSIIAGDDSQLCTLATPALTAVSRDIHGFGMQTARVLLDVIDGLSPGSYKDSPPRLVVRASTAPPS